MVPSKVQQSVVIHVLFCVGSYFLHVRTYQAEAEVAERSKACERKRQREAREAAAEKEHAAAGLLVAHEQATVTDNCTDDSTDTAFASRQFETPAELSFDEEKALFEYWFESLGRGAVLPLS